ncbi:hypothetical protein NPS53_09045 [Pseudomonas putida]|uniref:hypothetical protein n=1 Tax=Pseudomonas putida TaxID=303 RepID=UPI002363BC80|nr:hypothetical protein [Pseudomonas putida]MDD2139721.1 hypothetical protein [Pseudomonas putida]HDS1721645.1 hypothetical protein [Pseudomonas putida]
MAPTLSNAHLATVLPNFTAGRLSTLRTRYGLPEFVGQTDRALTVNWLTLLGQIEDDLLAQLVSQRFGVLITAPLIAAIREDLGVTSYSTRKPKLEPNLRALVGNHQANNLEKGWGVSVSVIKAYHRLTHGLPCGGPPADSPTPSRWPLADIDSLRHMTNAQIARATGLSLKMVRKARITEGIPAPTTRTYWKLVSDSDLANMSDGQLSELHGGPLADYAEQRLAKALLENRVAQEIARTRELPAQFTHFLNKMSLKRLAKLTGVSEFYLKRQRDGLGMEPYDPFPPEFEALLGTIPDSEVAEKTHTAVSTVKYRRDKLGLPAYTPRKER